MSRKTRAASTAQTPAQQQQQQQQQYLTLLFHYPPASDLRSPQSPPPSPPPRVEQLSATTLSRVPAARPRLYAYLGREQNFERVSLGLETRRVCVWC